MSPPQHNAIGPRCRHSVLPGKSLVPRAPALPAGAHPALRRHLGARAIFDLKPLESVTQWMFI